MSGMMEKVKAKVDGVLHKDKTHDDPTGPHSSHAANSADPRVDSDRVGTAGNMGSANTTHGTTHGTTTHTGSTGYSDPNGPHDSHMANKADPRVDSDRVGTAGNMGSTTHGTTGTHTGIGSTTHGTTGTHGTSNYNDPNGPHSSHMANKADPRVDSDRVGAAGNMGSAGYSDPTGPHNSHLANQADPRVGGVGSTTGTHTGLGSSTHNTTGTHGLGTSHNDPTGPHSSHLANQADPRVGGVGSTTGTHTGTHTGLGSSTHGTTGTHTGLGSSTHNTTGTHGLGTSHNDPTGPHSSHLANKADPRVDSDRVGTAGNMGSGNLAHRDHETGDLPKALVEPQSHAVPHSSLQNDHHTTGTHNTTGVHNTHDTTGVHGTHGATDVHGKPSLKDKLNPKKDADFDGKPGIMD